MDYTSKEYWNGIIKMSLTKFFILRVLYVCPMHGYEIARTVANVTKGCCTPTEGTIYPILKEFEQGEYLYGVEETVGKRKRRVYHITTKGKEAFGTAVAAWEEVSIYIVEAIGLKKAE